MPRESRIDLLDLDIFTDQRREVHYGLSGIIPATVKGMDGPDMDVVMLDVSRAGLGFLASNFQYRVGDILRLCIEGEDAIYLFVRWIRRSRLGENVEWLGLSRVGLAAQATQKNLLHRSERFGSMDQ